MNNNNASAVIKRTELHWANYKWPLFLLFVLIVSIARSADPIIPGVAMLMLVLFARAILWERYSYFLLSENKLVLYKGILSKNVIEIGLDRFEAIRIHQSAVGRALNFGTVTVTGNGGARLTLDDVKYPESFKSAVLDCVTTIKGDLHG